MEAKKKEGIINANLKRNLRNIITGKSGGSVDLMDGELYHECGFFKAKFLRRKEALSDDFLLSSISEQSGKIIWDFQREHFKGRGLLFMIERLKEFIIILEEWGKIIKIIPVADLLKDKRKPDDLIRIKEIVAEELGMIPIFSKEENALLIDQNKEKELKKREEEKRERARKQEKELIRSSIRDRKEIYAVDFWGRRLRGIPVTEKEWKWLLPPDAAILVKKHFPGQIMEAEEAFFVKRNKDNEIEKISRKIAFPEPFGKFEAKVIGVKFDDPTNNQEVPSNFETP